MRCIWIWLGIMGGCAALPSAIVIDLLAGAPSLFHFYTEKNQSEPHTWRSKCRYDNQTSPTPTVMPNILCLDLGTQMGWALRTEDGTVTSSSVCLRGDRFSGGGMRFLNFQRWLDGIVKHNPIHAVYFESVRRHLGTDAAHCYGGFLATLTAWCEAEGIPYQGIGIGTWKKAVCGRGHASKKEVIAAVSALGYDPVDDNEADALGVMLCAL